MGSEEGVTTVPFPPHPRGTQGRRDKKGASDPLSQFAFEEAKAREEGKERSAGRSALYLLAYQRF